VRKVGFTSKSGPSTAVARPFVIVGAAFCGAGGWQDFFHLFNVLDELESEQSRANPFNLETSNFEP